MTANTDRDNKIDIGKRILNFFGNFFVALFNRLRRNEKSEEFDFGREVFAEEIANKIIEQHNKNDSSFIFGISAYWGEGKTFLLKKIEKKLINKNYIVVWFSPWKYSEDKITLMRMFIRVLNNGITFPLLKIKLDDFDRDQTTLRFNLKNFALLSILFILVYIFFLKYINSYIKFLPDLSPLYTLILIPIMVAIIGKVLTVQQDQKAISTIDKFDLKIKEILRRYKFLRKKIVIFVDDLDRIGPREAKIVLDGLRTFFDKPDISYVVTGDNKVLEAAVGGSVVDDEGSKAEGGRRFLKKIFNVYWRMPLPSQSQIKSFIENRMEKSPFIEEDKKIFSKWMLSYFDLNPRNIERFIETINFNIHSLEKQLVELKGRPLEQEQIKQIKEVLNNKLLLTRALIFQEKTFPLFEIIVNNPLVIRDIEKSLDEGESDLSRYFKDLKLTSSQLNFLSQFLSENPKFYQDGGMKVNLVPFFKLTAEVGLSDERGISTEAFVKLLDQKDHLKIKQWLSIGVNLDPLSISAQQRIDTEGDLTNKASLVDTLIMSLEENPNGYVFLKSIVPNAINQLKDFDVNVTAPIFTNFFKFLDKLPEKEVGAFSTQITFAGVNNIDLIKEKLGKNSTLVVLNWFKSYLNQDMTNALVKFKEKAALLESSIDYDFINEIDIVNNNFLNLPIVDRENALTFLQYVREGMKKFKTKFSTEFLNLNETQKNELIDLIKNKFGDRRWGQKKVIKWLKEQ